MPSYQQIITFMGDVRCANPTFGRLINSRLHALIDILKDNNGNAAQVRQALRALNPAAVAKYREAIWYLQATYPGLVRDVLPMGPRKNQRCTVFPNGATTDV
ncbi:MAG: hypothetical protein GY749_29030 [Desulfobacteraceae bacterium]|nr:hypothetical protein [Desulfobacteraceae bacterium]